MCWQDDPRQVPHFGPTILEWPVNLTVMWHFVLSTLNWYILWLVREMLKLLGTIIQNFVARVTRCPEIVHSCTYALYILMLMTVQLVPVNHKHRFSCTDILNSLFSLHRWNPPLCKTQFVCFKLWSFPLWHCIIRLEVTRGTVNFHPQNSHDGVIFHKSTIRPKIVYLSIPSMRQSG